VSSPSISFAWSILLFLFPLMISFTWAQESESSNEPSCSSQTVVSVPSRPTVTSSTDTTQCGVAELEYGLERQWPGSGAHRDDLSGGLRFGILPNLDFHWASADFLHIMDGAGDRTGFGDTWVGLKYRISGQTKIRPALGVFYQAKLPSASVIKGLGSGEFDHSFAFLVTKDVHHIHFDFNVIPLLAGKPAASGWDHNTGFALSAAIPLTRRFSIVTEPYGYTSLAESAPAFAAWMAGCTYAASPRLVFDSGVDFGVTHDAPRERVWVGVTYALANIYSRLLPSR
jgi:hypothetical protein